MLAQRSPEEQLLFCVPRLTPRWLRRKLVGSLVVFLKGPFREYAPRVGVTFSFLGDGPHLVVSCLVLPRPVEPRPSPRSHLLGVLVAVELEAPLRRRQVKVFVSFLAHGSLHLPV